MKKTILIIFMTFLLISSYGQMNTKSFQKYERNVKIINVTGIVVAGLGILTLQPTLIYMGLGFTGMNYWGYINARKGGSKWRVNRKMCDNDR